MLPHHLNPAQALQAADDLEARWMVPIHFGTFVNSFDAPGECEAALRTAMQGSPEFKVHVALLHVGEQAVLIGQDRGTRHIGAAPEAHGDVPAQRYPMTQIPLTL